MEGHTAARAEAHMEQEDHMEADLMAGKTEDHSRTHIRWLSDT